MTATSDARHGDFALVEYDYPATEVPSEVTPALAVAAFRHLDNRDGFPLLHAHCPVLTRLLRLDDDCEPVWGRP
ncbi:hypothetical protein SAMN06272771_0054 [Streptomyces sp. Ag82_O1-12]|uniref:hypothetical protein n=1 Tax=unclassified Streptomyces TaxID=2593676 RepID=UPI000BC4F047|nr:MULTISPECIES: hypothetical protein [unclassified Streptomyces]SMQ13783.1 hypothetical protein SAMN06272771_0054 [Streptomyces sp. Ag82_O1-12]SOD42813.1 hypothetical protein SAMN06272727_0043 [Streptomyces sp. Ag82_G6-1]